MADKEIVTLKGQIKIHTRIYEMYCGFMTPNELLQFCSVPSYNKDSTNHAIANSLKTPPIDNWQRPLDTERLESIRANIDSAILGNADNDSLMTNPVLIGRSDKIGNPGVNLTIDSYKVSVGNRQESVDSVKNIIISSNDGNKPLWVLDGQHRIHGLGNSPMIKDGNGNPVANGSIVADETIPVVFIIDEIYTPKFLAKIFTEVTTEAKPMEPLHSDWMQFSFNMGHYKNRENARKAMLATIELSTLQTIDAAANRFCSGGGQIAFNPYLSKSSVKCFKNITAIDFRSMFESEYYGMNGEGNATQLSTAFVRFFRATEKLDDYSNSNSKLTSSGASEVLVAFFYNSFLNYLATDMDLLNYLQEDWEHFLDSEGRKFSNSDWRLEDTGATGGNKATKPASNAAEITMRKFFNQPSDFDGENPADWMQGSGNILIQTAPLSASGRFPPRQNTPHELDGGGGGIRINLRRHDHKMLRIKQIPGSIESISSIQRKIGSGRAAYWETIAVNETIVLDAGNQTDVLKINTLSYGEASETTITLTLTS